MALGDKIKALRENEGWSTNQLADRAGVSRPYLWQLETGGKDQPSFSVVEKLARVLGVSVEEFCERPTEKLQKEGLPPGLAEFVEKKGQDFRLRASDVDMLQNVRFRGRQPDNPEDWELLFLFLRKWSG